MVVLPTPPFGAKIVMTCVDVLGAGLRVLADRVDAGHEFETGERHREDTVDAGFGIGLDRVLGHREDDDRHTDIGVADLLDQLRAFQATLKQGVHDHDVWPELLDRRERLRALTHHFEEFHPGLGIQKAADVLSDLGDILDDQQPRLVALWHPPDDTTGFGRGTYPEVPAL